MDKVSILGIQVSKTTKPEILNWIENSIIEGEPSYITTPNPEIVLNAQKNEELFFIINHSDFAIPDGIGLKFASWTHGQNLNRITGADLCMDVLTLAEKNNYSLGIIMWSGGLTSKKTLESVLQKKYPALKFEIEELRDRTKINHQTKLNTDLIFITLGSPYQELLINQILCVQNKKTVVLGLGQSLDFIANTIKRSPKALRIIGLEWLWRLIKQPWRLKRILNATIVFPLKFLKWRFINPFLYRPNVACFLYKKNKAGYKVLIIERKDESDHWQLPQGGRDGESLIKAAKREMIEELGTNKFKITHYAGNIGKYRFSKGKPTEFGIPRQKIMGYKGQKQGVVFAEYKGLNKDINTNYWECNDWKWVDVEELSASVNKKRQQAAKTIVREFKNLIDQESTTEN